VLAVLFVGAFAMGCAEMLVLGMLVLIATDLAVSVPDAGALVTANALGLAIRGPVLGVGFLAFAGLQSALTSLMPFLDQVSGVSGPLVGAGRPPGRRRDPFP
jgi:DHA1 family inner membrane transport protein